MHKKPETEAQRLDRLAWKQRLEDIEKYRKKTRRQEWWLDRIDTLLACMIVFAVALILLGTILLLKGG